MYLGDAINELCEKSNGNDDIVASITDQKSSLKLSILNLIKKNAQFLMGHFLMKNEDNKKERVVDFLQILQLVANEIFGDVIYDVNFRKSVNQCKAKDLPSNEDVRLLMNGCEEVMKSIDYL